MTNLTIRISTSASGTPVPAPGIPGAFGAVSPGASDDTTVEVTLEDLPTMGDAVVAAEGFFPLVSLAFANAALSAEIETVVDADVLDNEKSVDEDAEKRRRKQQRKRAVRVVTPLLSSAQHSLQDWDEDAKDIVKALENEGIIR